MLRMFNWLHLNSSDVRQICKFSFGELRAMAGEEVIAVELWFLKLDHMWCEVVISLSNQLCGRSYNYRKLQQEDSRIHPPPGATTIWMQSANHKRKMHAQRIFNVCANIGSCFTIFIQMLKNSINSYVCALSS